MVGLQMTNATPITANQTSHFFLPIRQRVAALDKLYLAETLPVLIVRGENDPIIPVEHAREAHAQLPDSHLEVFENTGHIPQQERPGRFIAVLERFLAETEPAEFDREEWLGRFKAVGG